MLCVTEQIRAERGRAENVLEVQEQISVSDDRGGELHCSLSETKIIG